MKRLGVDVSTWQGGTDFQAVKESGIEFAILRSSFGSPDPSQVDNQFENHYRNAKAAGYGKTRYRKPLPICCIN